jgi:uncharacterized protein HemY
MAEIIFCPSCRRRLQLPSDFQDELVRCPGCHTDFQLSSDGAPLRETLPPMALPADDETPVRRPEPRSVSRGRPVRKSSRGTCLIVLSVVGLVGAVFVASVAGIVLLAGRSTPPPTSVAAHFPEDDEEDFARQIEVFRGRAPLVEANIAPELLPLFNLLGLSLRLGDANGVMRQFDVDRATDEFIDLAIVPPRKTPKRRQFLISLRRGMGRSLMRRGEDLQWTTFEIRQVKKKTDDECAAVVCHRQSNGSTLKIRWWLTRRAGEWKIYDFEDLDTGRRFSVASAPLVQQGGGLLTEIGRAGAVLLDALDSLLTDDVAAAENHLKRTPANLPPRLEALRLLLRGRILLRHGQFQDMVDALEESKRLHPDPFLADYLLGVARNRVGKWEQALTILRAYRALVGDEDEMCRETGLALRQLRRFPEAASEYRKALDLNPKNEAAFLGFLQSLGGDDDKDDVGRRFEQLDDLRQNFDQFAQDCVKRQFPQLLEPLVQTMHRLDADYPPVDFYRALVAAWTGHPDDAVRLIQSAFRKQTEEVKRREYGRQFLEVMAAMGHFKQAYPVLADAREAFRCLAAETRKRYRLDELKALIALHRAKDAGDPLLLPYQAEIHVREARYAEADKCFDEAVKRRVDAETLAGFRVDRVLARYHNGRMMSAYRDIGPPDETFLQLAALCFEDEDDKSLETLIDAHAKNARSSAEVPRFRARMKIRQKKIAEGIILFKEALAKQKDEDKRERLISEFLDDMAGVGEPLQAYRAAPDPRQAFWIVARILRSESRFDELRMLVSAHRAVDAADPRLAYYRGELHLRDKEWSKAAVEMEQAMKRATKEQRETFRGRYVYALYRAGRGLQAYATTEARDKVFDQLANLLSNDKKGVELEALIRAHRPHADLDDPRLLYRECQAKLLLKKLDEAIPLFQKAYGKDKLDYRRDRELGTFLSAALDAGRFTDGWRAVPDKAAAFNALAPLLLSQKKQKELLALMEEYGKERGDDAALAFYRGELALRNGQPKEAARHFAAAVAKADARHRWSYRHGLFRCRIDLGEAAAVYEQFHADAGIFETLANLCEQKKDARQLSALLDAHRKRQANDPASITWQMEVHWLKQEYEAVLRLLTEHHNDVFSLPRYHWKTTERRVRCLVKLKRNREAIQEAEAEKKAHGDRFSLLLAYAAAGDAPRTVATMEKVRYRSYLIRRCYEDEDLGPILRGDAFRAFREKFPAPKPENGADPGEGDEDD